jgi:tetratricopeptide (TPR) repeat protein
MALEPPLEPFALRSEQARGAFVFFSYAHQDKRFRDKLEAHLSNLKYRGLISTWHDREIRAGEEWAQQIDIYLNKAHIILLLISSDFMASEYCYSIEMKRALERHEQGEADVVPILLRPVLYTDAPFAKLEMLPTNGKPVIRWRDRDSAFFDIACGIERVAQKYPIPPVPPPARALPGERLLRLIISILDSLGGPAIVAIPARSARERRYYEEAIEAYRRALSRNPSDGDAHRGMGNALYALGHYDQALDAFAQAINCDTTPAAYAGLGDVFARLRRYSEAVAAYERAIELDPTVTLNYDDFIRSLRALGRKDEAEQVHARAKQLGYEDEE